MGTTATRTVTGSKRRQSFHLVERLPTLRRTEPLRTGRIPFRTSAPSCRQSNGRKIASRLPAGGADWPRERPSEVDGIRLGFVIVERPHRCTLVGDKPVGLGLSERERNVEPSAALVARARRHALSPRVVRNRRSAAHAVYGGARAPCSHRVDRAVSAGAHRLPRSDPRAETTLAAAPHPPEGSVHGTTAWRHSC